MSILDKNLLAKDMPVVFDPLNNGQGTFHYNHNIKEVMVIVDDMGAVTVTDDEEKATGSMYQYDSLRVEYPKTADHIFATLLTAKYPADRESKLVNEYQSAELGLIDEMHKQPYVDFLQDRLAIRAMVDADCIAHNIPIEL